MTPETLAAIVVFGGIAIIFPAFFVILGLAEVSAEAARWRRRLVLILCAWFAIPLTVGWFVPLAFPIFLPFALIPIAAGFALSFHPAVAELLARAPTHLLVWLSVYRTLGFVFLAVYWMGGDLSWGFARNAGWGDVLTGVLAVPVGWMLWRRVRGAEAALIGWSIIGIGDLILAPASARMFGAGEALIGFPLNLIPLFLGPPFGILLHLWTLRAFYLKRSAAGLAGAVG